MKYQQNKMMRQNSLQRVDTLSSSMSIKNLSLNETNPYLAIKEYEESEEGRMGEEKP